MNDRRINELVRMTVEIDELERSAMQPAVQEVAPTLRVVGREHADRLRRHRRVWVVRTVALASAAASLGLVVRMSLPVPSQSAPASPPVAMSTEKGPTEVAAIHQPHIAPPLFVEKPLPTPVKNRIARGPALPDVSGMGSVVLAIFEDAGGVVRCVRWREHDFGDRDISAIRPGELAAATYGSQCVVGPHRLIAVGLTGPRDQLPTTEEGAQAMAQCIIGGQRSACDIEPAAANSSTLSCLPHGLKVMVETLAMGKP